MKTPGIADQPLFGQIWLFRVWYYPARRLKKGMKPIELTVPKLHKKGVVAITLWPFILYRREHRDDIALRAHEHFHWHHARRWFVLPWYLWYLVLVPFYFRRPSNEHPLERPAYELQWQIQAKLQAGTSIDAELATVGLAEVELA